MAQISRSPRNPKNLPRHFTKPPHQRNTKIQTHRWHHLLQLRRHRKNARKVTWKKTKRPATAPVKFAPASQQIKLTEMLSCRAQSRHLRSRHTFLLLLLNCKVIYTGKLVHYKSILKDVVHNTKPFGTNHIERKNLSLRTHLKRLNRKTICFSKSFILLQCVLRIYFWG